MDQDFTALLLTRAQQNPANIVFPEATQEKVLLAVSKAFELNAAKPILVGKLAEIQPVADEAGVDLSGFKIIDNTDEETCNRLIAEYLKINDVFSERSLLRKFKSTLNFAAAMVACNWADCMAAGITYTTGEILYQSQVFIGLKENISTVSSLGIAHFPNFKTSQGNLLTITDCAVCPEPDSEELADIAISTSDTMKKLLGWDTRAAMLSFSTKGSAQHALTEKVANAVIIANEKRPDLKIDGEFQIDAAIIPEVAAKKVTEPSEVAGKANIIVFPGLEAGNIGVKIMQIFGGALAYGPLLQGFRKPVTDFSRSAPVDEIVGNLIMLSVLAQE